MGDGEVLLPFLKKGESCWRLQTEQLELACGQTRAVPAGGQDPGKGRWSLQAGVSLAGAEPGD